MTDFKLLHCMFILNICVKQTLQWITAGSDKMLTHEAILMLFDTGLNSSCCIF